MTRNALKIIIVIVSVSLSSATPALAQETRPGTDHVTVARGLLKQLQWHDVSSHNQYLATRDDVTQRLLTEIDGFVTESFRPKVSTPDQIKAGLDILLGYATGMAPTVNSNTAFLLDLPSGHFLITGIEIPRGGGAIAEDAISLRAYKGASTQFIYVSNTQDLRSSDSDNHFLARLYTKALTWSPIASEFWFMALAEVPPQAPPIVALRLYAFDGEKFRTVWMPKDIRSEGADKTIELTTNGFTVGSLFDPTGQAAHSPSVIIHEQYSVSPDGPYKTYEWRTERQ